MEGKSVNFLQKQIEQLKRERAALLEIVARETACDYCLHAEDNIPCLDSDGDVGECEMCKLNCYCKGCENGSKFEWNGKGYNDGRK